MGMALFEFGTGIPHLKGTAINVKALDFSRAFINWVASIQLIAQPIV